MPKHIFKEEEPKIDILPNLGDSLNGVEVVVVVDVVAAVVVVEKAVLVVDYSWIFIYKKYDNSLTNISLLQFNLRKYNHDTSKKDAKMK